MQIVERVEALLWIVRYVSMPDQAIHSAGCPQPGYAIFRASDEAQVRRKLTRWLAQTEHRKVIVSSIELLPAMSMRRLPPLRARQTRLFLAERARKLRRQRDLLHI